MTATQQEALTRATTGESSANYAAIIAGFSEKGIPADEIQPRENVYTFAAWKALGRNVRKGEHGIKVNTVIERERQNKATQEPERVRIPWITTVFHVSQTEPIGNSLPVIETKPETKTATMEPAANLAPRFRKWGDALTDKVKHLSRPMTQNPTPKRTREYQSRLHEARNWERLEKALNVLADLHDAGAVPPELAGFKTKEEIGGLVRKLIDHSKGGYYSCIEADDYADTTPAGRMMQAMIGGSSSDRAERERLRKIGEMEAEIRLTKIPGYFPTPAPIAEIIVDRAGIAPGHTIIEPSAGNGNLADAVRRRYPANHLEVCEINYRLREILALKGHTLAGCDFMETTFPSQWDRIVMNPPFENGQDMDHVRCAFDCLKAGGILVSVMSPHFDFASDRKSEAFRDWLDDVNAECGPLPDGAFKASGTEISTLLVVIRK